MNNLDPGWAIRRRVIIYTLIYCGAVIAYLSAFGDDSRLNETIVMALAAVGGSTIGSYVFGATWDDRNKMKFKEGGDR